MTELLKSVTLLHGWVQPVAYVLAAVTVATLWWFVTRRLRWRCQLVIPAVGLAGGLGCWAVVDVWLHPIPGGIGAYVWTWVGVIATTTLQAALAPRHRGPRDWPRSVARGAARATTVLVVVMCAMLAVNVHFTAYRSLADVFGVGIDRVAIQDIPAPRPGEEIATGGILEQEWAPPPDLPAAGKVVTVSIPASDSTFTPRDAIIYLPPAYLTATRPVLPVLVLMAGIPGSPDDWVSKATMVDSLNAYARQHKGLAPIVVAIDQLGHITRNPLCSDAHLGNVATYIERDVPAWLKANFAVDPNPSRWAIGGLSNGGTCAMQAVTRAPGVYQTFLSMSGELQLNLGSVQEAVAVGFDGDEERYRANDPLSLMTTRRYPEIAGIFSFGEQDQQYEAYAEKLNAAAQQAGMTTEIRRYPGNHEFAVWSAALADQLTWLGTRLGLTT